MSTGFIVRLMFRTAEEAFQFFAAGEWAFTRSLSYRLGGGVGTVAGRAQWKPWPYPVAAGSVTSVDATPLPERDHLLLYDEVRCISLCAARTGAAVLNRDALHCGSAGGSARTARRTATTACDSPVRFQLCQAPSGSVLHRR